MEPLAISTISSVTFILTGRITLSEHLPNESIEVTASIANRSLYLRALVQQHTSLHRAFTNIELRGIDPAGFKIYLEWLNLNQNTSPFRWQSAANSKLLLCECVGLIYAHIVGSKLQEPGFQDYIIDEISRLLDPTQTIDVTLLELVFVEKGASGVLQRFVTEKMFALEKRMLGMLRGSVGETMCGGDQTTECKYHVHDAGNCYRDLREIRTKGRWKSDRKRWNTNSGEESRSTIDRFCGKASDCNFTGEIMPAEEPNIYDTERYSSKAESSRSISRSKASAMNNYFGPTSEVHALKVTSSAPASHDKAEIVLSAPPLQVAPLHPFSQYEKNNEKKIRSAISTHDIITECLQRLLPKPPGASKKDLNTDFLNNLLLNFSSVKAGERSAVPIPDRRTACSEIRSLDKDLTSVILQSRAASSAPGHSSDVLNPPLDNRQQLIPVSCSPSDPPSLRPIISRKPAPPRGLDWIEQWDCLNTIKDTQARVVRMDMKSEKKSRFKELLTSVGKLKRSEKDYSSKKSDSTW